MGSRAIAWLVGQYRCVLGRMRLREHLAANPLHAPRCGRRTGAAAALPAEGCRRAYGVETLEQRVMLSASPGELARQVFLLSTGGATDVDYRGPVAVEDVDVPAFAAPGALAGREGEVLDALLDELGDALPGVTFVTEPPAAGAYSTVHVGGDGAWAARWGDFYGLAEQVDAGNRDRADVAFVFSDAIEASGMTADAYGRLLAGVVAHEAGHLLGESHGEHHHDHDPDRSNPLADVAFDPKVHVAIGDDALADALDDGKVTLGGASFAVHPKVVTALQDHRPFYNAGVVGPDGFPDSIMGQFVLHAERHGVWATRMLDMAWRAQDDPTYSATAKSQILAFAYGYLTHSTGDFWAHTLVNEFTEGVAPGFIAAGQSIPTDQRDLGNMIRHFMTEAYIANALEGVDANPDRTEMTPGGDITDDTTPGIAYDAPVRFIYETLIRAFPDDPTQLAELDWEGATLAATSVGNRFVRVSTSAGGLIGGLLGDSFKVGQRITVSGFDNPANNGTFIVTGVTDSTAASTVTSVITVDRPLVDEVAGGDEAIVVHVPKTPVTTIRVDAAGGKFIRTTGSFVEEGFVAGQRFSAFGFNEHFDNFIVENVTPTELVVVGKLKAGDEAGSGDEQLVVQGDRGPIVNKLLALRDYLYTKAVARGERGADFATRVGELVDKAARGESFGDDFNQGLFTAYLYQWADNIEEGVRRWGEFGLAFTKAMFDPQSRRDVQNKVGAAFGPDTLGNTARAAAEAGVKMYNVLLAELSDRNGDGDDDDSYLANHLLPMLLGVPRGLGVVLSKLGVLDALMAQLQQEADLTVKPTEVTADAAKAESEGWVKRLFRDRWGVDFDTLDVLHNVHARMDVESLKFGDTVIPIFKPGDHERLDALLGMPPDHHVAGAVDPIVNVTFHTDAQGVLKDDAHFDKGAFAAYKNSVTLTKMMLLMEAPPDGSASGAGQLSALYSHLTGAPYDFAKLNLHGAHGGNVLTSTLPGVNGTRPWLESIDADQVWRADSYTVDVTKYRVSTQNDTFAPARWEATVPAGTYRVYATWLANVTRDLPDLSNPLNRDTKIEPATNAKFTVFNGASPFGEVPKNQGLFPSAFEFDGIGYEFLGEYDIASGQFALQLSNLADGHVIAGPVVIERVGGGAPIHIVNLRDPATLAPLAPANDYADDPASWTDLAYPTGGGNNPLWESALLRPAFRALFTDWRNGALQFPDLGDATSPDPNATPVAKTQLPSHATPSGKPFADGPFQVPILAGAKALLLDGLNGVAGLLGQIESAAPFDVSLPGLNKSLAELLGMGGKFDARVRQPVLDYFAADATPTFQELFAALPSGFAGSLDTYSPVLEFDVDLRELFTADVGLSLGAEADALGLTVSGTLTADAVVKFVDAVLADLPKLTLGLDLTPDGSVALGDRAYVRADRALLSLDLNATGVNLGANFGLVAAGVVNGTVHLSADVEVVFVDPNTDGKITLGEIAATALGDLVDVTPTGSLSGTLPIRVQPGIGGFGNLDVGSLAFGATDLFDPSTYDVTFTGDFSALQNLGQLTFDDLLNALDEVVAYLGKLEQFGFVNAELPLINRSVADVLGAATKLAAEVNALRADPAGSLQAVEAKLEGLFGADTASLALSGPTLKINFQFSPEFDETLPLDFDLASLPGLPDALAGIVDLTGSGSLRVTGGASFNVGLGLDLTDPAAPVPFLDDTTAATLRAKVATPTPIDFTLSIFGLGAAINDATFALHAAGNPAGDATFAVSLLTGADGRIDFSELGTLSASNVSVALDGAARVVMPFEFPPGTAINDALDISIPSLSTLLSGGPNPVVVNSYPDFESLLGGLDLSGGLTSLLNSLDQLLGLLQAGLDNGAFAKRVPLVGDKLKDGANVIGRFRQQFLAQIQPFINDPAGKSIPSVRNALFQALGPAGLNLLVDGSDADSVVSASDIGVVVDSTADPSDVRFMLRLVRAAETVTLPLGFDVGLPALGLSAQGAVQVNAGFDLNLGLGFSKTAGPYLYAGAADELKVNVDVRVPGLAAKGRLGFLNVDVRDDAANPSHFTAGFNVDLDGGGDHRLTVGELTGAAINADLDASAVADVNLKLAVSYEQEAKFPRIFADLNLDWAFGGADAGGGGAFGAAPRVAFNNVALELGSFLSNFARPVLETVQQALGPIQPVVDFLGKDIPALAKVGKVRDYFDANRDKVVTVEEVIRKLDGGAVFDLIAGVRGLNDLVNAVQNVGSVGANAVISLGSFNLNNLDLRALPNLNAAPLTNVNAATNVEQQLAGLVPGFASALGDDRLGASGNAGGGKLSFPILQNPREVFSLFMGKDPDLFLWDMPKFAASLSISESFPVFGPIEIGFEGSVGIAADFTFGYDTTGLRKLANGGSLGDVFDGFFLLDKPAGSSEDPSEISATGRIAIFASVDAVIVSGKVEGALVGTLDLNLHDPDDSDGTGKVRFDDLTAQLNKGLLCVFDIAGELSIEVLGKIKVGIGWASKTWSMPFAKIQLLDFTHTCDDTPSAVPQDPVLATDLGGGVLRLNMGPHAADRLHGGDVTDNDESFYVLADPDDPTGVIVTAYGYSQKFANVTKVVGEGGLGNDTINLAVSLNVQAELYGDFKDPARAGEFGNDQLTGGEGAATIRGGGGDDFLQGRSAADLLYGEAGNDAVLGGEGADRVEGNDGDDTVSGEGGDDTAYGGAGDDLVEGGAGADLLYGDAGDDTLVGDDESDDAPTGSSDDTLHGGDGADVLHGGEGDDALNGDAGNDSVFGDAGADTLHGNAGDDSVRGGDGNDVIAGDDNDDELHGDAGDDAMTGDGGADVMFGGDGDDDMSGNAGGDEMHGDGGADVMRGNDGADTMSGGAGDDEMTGDAGADVMAGDDGDDVMLGDGGTVSDLAAVAGPKRKGVVLTPAVTDGADDMDGGAGDDQMYGGGADDTMDGALGDDYMEGNAGADSMLGGDGEDDMVGGSSDAAVKSTADRTDGADAMDGGAGHDVMAGDNARIARRVDGSGAYLRFTAGVGPENGAAIRDVYLLELDAVGGADTMTGGTGDDSMFGGLGDDRMAGNDGNDDLIGHLGADHIDGGAGSDGVVGDKGTIVTDRLDGSTARLVEANGNKMSETIDTAGTLKRLVTLADAAHGGNDVLLGGDGDDFVHAGAGDDDVDGGAGDDALFGNLGNDRVRGGAGADHLWGGSGDDDLDGQAGADTSYGGDGQDRLVADVRDDKLVDWFGNFNEFVSPGPGFGAPTIIRSPNPHVRDFLLALAAGDGATDPDGEAAVVTPPSPSNAGKGKK